MANEAAVGSLVFSFIGRAGGLKSATRHAAMSLNSFAHAAEKSSNRIQSSLMGIGVVSVAALAASTAAFASFDEQMKRSTSLFEGLSKTLYKDMSDQAKKFAVEQGRSASDVAGSYYYLASAGFDAAEALVLLPKVLQFATASNLTAAKATELLSDATFALGMRSRDAAKQMESMTYVSDIIMKATMKADATAEQFAMGLARRAGPMIQAFGVDVRDATGALMVFANQGIKGSQASTFLGMAIREVTRAAGQNREEWDRMGISVFDNTGKMRRFVDIFSDMRQVFRGISDEDLIKTLRGMGIQARAAQPIIAMMTSVDELRRNVADLNDVSDVTRKIWETRLESLAVLGKRFSESIKVIGINIGEALASPGALKMLEGMVVAFQRFGEWLGRIDKGLLGFATGAVALAAGGLLVGKALMFAGKFVKSFFTDIARVTTAVVPAGPAMETMGDAALKSARKMSSLIGQNKKMALALGLVADKGTRMTEMLIKLSNNIGGLGAVSAHITELGTAAGGSFVLVGNMAKAVGALGRAMAMMNAESGLIAKTMAKVGTSVVALQAKFKGKSAVINTTAEAIRNLALAMQQLNTTMAMSQAMSPAMGKQGKPGGGWGTINKAAPGINALNAAAQRTADTMDRGVASAVKNQAQMTSAYQKKIATLNNDMMVSKAHTTAISASTSAYQNKIAALNTSIAAAKNTTASLNTLAKSANKAAVANTGVAAGGKGGMLSMLGGGLMAAGFKVMAIYAIAQMTKMGIDKIGQTITGDENWESVDALAGSIVDGFLGTNKKLAAIERHNSMIAKHGLTYDRLSRALRNSGKDGAKEIAQNAHKLWAEGRGQEAVATARAGVAGLGIKLENKELNAAIAGAFKQMQERDISSIKILETAEVADLRKALNELKEEIRRSNMQAGARMAEDVGKVALGKFKLEALTPQSAAAESIAQQMTDLAGAHKEWSAVAAAMGNATVDDVGGMTTDLAKLSTPLRANIQNLREELAKADLGVDFKTHVGNALDAMEGGIPSEDQLQALRRRYEIYVDQDRQLRDLNKTIEPLPDTRDWGGWLKKNSINLFLAPLTGGLTLLGLGLDRDNKLIERQRAANESKTKRQKELVGSMQNDVSSWATGMAAGMEKIDPAITEAMKATTTHSSTLKSSMLATELAITNYMREIKEGTKRINEELSKGYADLMDSIVGREGKDAQIAHVRGKIDEHKKNVEMYAMQVEALQDAQGALAAIRVSVGGGMPFLQQADPWGALREQLDKSGASIFKGQEFNTFFESIKKAFDDAEDKVAKEGVFKKAVDVMLEQAKRGITDPQKELLGELGELDKATGQLQGLTEVVSNLGQAASVVERGSVEAYRAERRIGKDYMQNVDKNTERMTSDVAGIHGYIKEMVGKFNVKAI